MSTSSVDDAPKTRAKAANDDRSSGNDWTQECAIVPEAGIPSRRAASAWLVPAKPAMYAARAARNPACGPCPRRAPNSCKGRPPATVTIRAAFEATSVG